MESFKLFKVFTIEANLLINIIISGFMIKKEIVLMVSQALIFVWPNSPFGMQFSSATKTGQCFRNSLLFLRRTEKVNPLNMWLTERATGSERTRRKFSLFLS